MDTSLEHRHAEEQAHEEMTPQIRARRARAGVLMLIISDALGALALLAGGGYLSALNTEGQFKVAGDFAPAFVPGLLIMIGLALSGLAYCLWERKARKPGGTGQPLFFLLALILMLVVGVGETWLGAALKYGGPNVTIDAYQSVQLLIVWFTAVHLLFAAAIGLLLGGRILRGRIAGHAYIPEVTGYWWYYTVIATLILWLFGLFLT
jgi:hypothetical protein